MSFAEPAVILYDAECRVCRALLAAILVWDRRRTLRPAPLGTPEAERLLASVPRERWLESWHLVAPGAPAVSAGAGFAPLLDRLPGGSGLAVLCRRFPAAAERAYRFVAGRRGRLSPLVPGAAQRRADRLIAARS